MISSSTFKGNNCECVKCKQDFTFFPEDVFWDEKGFGYSTKLTHCPYCSQVNIIEYYEDRAMNNINNNDWEYDYSRY